MTLTANLRTFYILSITQIVSLLGSRMTAFALALRVSMDTGQATPIALVAFFTALPQILLGNVGGWTADRFDRRYVMAIADAGQAFGTLLLFFAFATNHFELWQLYAVTALQGIFLAFQMPATEATTTMLVPDELRDRANALRQMSGSLAGFFAPALAAVLLIAIDITGVMLIDLLSFVFAIVVVLFLRIPPPPKSAESVQWQNSFWQDLSAGFRYLLSRRLLLYFVLYAAFINFVLNATTTVILPYVWARTGDETITGLVTAAENLGIIIGGLVIGVWGGTRPRIHTIIIASVAVFIALAIFGTLRHPIALMIGMFLITFPLPIANAPFFSMLQAKTPADLQGRVFAVVMQLSSILIPLGLLLIGPVIDGFLEPLVQTEGWSMVAPLVGDETGSGTGFLFLLSGILLTVITLAFYTLPTVRQMEALLPDYHTETVVMPKPISE